MRKLKLQSWKELGLIACCYLIALLPPFWAEWGHDFSGVYYLYDTRTAYGVDTTLIILLIALGLACLTEYFGRWRDSIFTALIVVLALLGTVATGHVILYQAPVSIGAVDALLGSDLHETLEFLSFQWNLALAATGFGFGALVFGSICWVRPRLRQGTDSFRPHGVAWPLVFIMVMIAYQHPAVAAQNRIAVENMQFWSRVYDLNNQVPSLRILRNIGEWIHYREWLQQEQKQRALYAFHAKLELGARRTVVIVLGESMRRGNLSLYGYDKTTTPHLDALRKQLLIFNEAVAAANQTVPSVTMMLTTATVLDPNRFLQQPSIIAAAKEAGYHTFWLSNQGRVGTFESKISLVAHDADTLVYTNTEFYGSVLDQRLLHPLEVALRDEYPFKLIVIHLQGSHQDYEKRYPVSFDFFKADQYHRSSDTAAMSAQENSVMAEYDNSIRYTDSILGNILTQLSKEAGSILLFASDHGERFYENGVMSAGHGYSQPTKTEFQVPFFIWCKDGCQTEWKNAAAQHRNLAFSMENIFHTSTTILGLQMPDYNPEADILSQRYKPYPPQVIATERNVLDYASLP